MELASLRRRILMAGCLVTALAYLAGSARAQTAPTPSTAPAPAQAEAKPPQAEAKPPQAEAKPPQAEVKPPSPAAGPSAPAQAAPGLAAPSPSGTTPPASPPGKPSRTEIEPNGSPGVPENATTESLTVAPRTFVMVRGTSSYDEAFKSVKAAIEASRAAMTKAGLPPSGHAITVFSEPDDKGFKFQAGVPVAAAPGKVDLPPNVSIGTTPGGKAIKFQHRGAYDDIDSTYDVITAYLDAKGLQVENPYIEEYLTDLTTADDPDLQVDIYVFVKP